MSNPSSESDGTAHFSSWSWETGVSQAAPSMRALRAGAGAGGACLRDKTARTNWRYVRGGFPPDESRILEQDKMSLRTTVHYNETVLVIAWYETHRKF